MGFPYLTCTRCFRETPTEAEAGMGLDLALNWLCDDCLDDVEQEETDAMIAEREKRDAKD